MANISHKILNRIKEDQIKPKPKWLFSLKNIAIWLCFGIIAIIGGLAFDVILVIIQDHEWDIYENLHRTLIQHILLSLPYVWIISVIVLAIGAYFNLRKTKTGYRYKTVFVIAASILASLLLASVSYAFNIGSKINELIEQKNIPIYNSHIIQKRNIWSKPDSGLISGSISKINSSSSFTLNDFNGKSWEVSDQDANWKQKTERKEGSKLKIIGKKIDSDHFKAQQIRPWKKVK